MVHLICNVQVVYKQGSAADLCVAGRTSSGNKSTGNLSESSAHHVGMSAAPKIITCRRAQIGRGKAAVRRSDDDGSNHQLCTSEHRSPGCRSQRSPPGQ